MSAINKKVYLGVPTHDGRLGQGMINAIFGAGRSLEKTQIQKGSALTTNFNNCYANALSNRQHGITHFCLLHEDIAIQEPLWLDKMIGIMERVGADILSAVIPIKNDSGDTSTALEIEDASQVMGFRAKRMTIKECLAEGPTFTKKNLLVNSGLLLVDIRAPWAHKIWFEFRDSIHEDPKKPGVFFPVSLSEDFGFTRQARAHGAAIFATTEIRLKHMGGGEWKNWIEDGKGFAPTLISTAPSKPA